MLLPRLVCSSMPVDSGDVLLTCPEIGVLAATFSLPLGWWCCNCCGPLEMNLLRQLRLDSCGSISINRVIDSS
jgi:hypothetical protein